MTYNDFIEKLKGIKINDAGYGVKNDFLYHYPDGNKYGSIPKPKFDFIFESWETGGVSGGSCWDSSDPQPYSCSDNRPVTFGALDEILEAVCPQIGFLQYKLIKKDLVKTGENTEYEYYGNRTDYAYRYVNLEELFKFLTDKNLV